MKSLAVVMEEPQRLALASLPLDDPQRRRCRRRNAAGPASAPAPSGCSTPAACRPFPAWAIRWCPATRRSARWSAPGRTPGVAVGAQVFVPGAHCFGAVRGIHGGAASHLVAPGARVAAHRCALGERGVLLALAATALHALKIAAASTDATLIVGHGALGRLIARARRARAACRRLSGRPTPSAPTARSATA